MSILFMLNSSIIYGPWKDSCSVCCYLFCLFLKNENASISRSTYFCLIIVLINEQTTSKHPRILLFRSTRERELGTPVRLSFVESQSRVNNGGTMVAVSTIHTRDPCRE